MNKHVVRHSQQTLKLAFVLAFAGAILLINGFWATSIDLAHHYALINRLSELWGMPRWFDLSLMEMNYYPNYAHVLAVVFGVLGGSPFLGMHFVALLSVTLIWTSLAFILIRQRSSESKYFLFFFFVGLGCVKFLRFEVHGYEIVGDYFYAQLVGQAFLFLSLLVYCRLIDARKAYCASLFLASAAFFSAGIHLLAALELLAFLGIHIFVRYFFSATHSVRVLIFELTICSIGGVMVLLHPSFSAMTGIANNNGGLWFKLTPTVAGLSGVAVFVMFLSVVLLYLERCTDGRRADVDPCSGLSVISTYALAVVGLFFLQFIAYLLNFGSEYAVKKYGYGLNTSLVLLLVLLLARVFSGWRVEGGAHKQRSSSQWINVLPLIVAAIGILAVVPPKKDIVSAKALVDIDVATRNFYSLHPVLKNETGDALLDFPGARGVDAYMFSIGAMHLPRGQVAESIITGKVAQNFDNFRYLLVGFDSDLATPACVDSLAGSGLIAVDAACAKKAAVECKQEIDFSSGGNATYLNLGGFSYPEGFGRWTDGHTANVVCVAPRGFLESFPIMKLSFSGGFSPADIKQEFSVSLNGKDVGKFILDEGPQDIEVSLKDVDLASSGRLEISLDIPNAVSPQAMGLGQDTRMLGLGLSRIRFSPITAGQ